MNAGGKYEKSSDDEKKIQMYTTQRRATKESIKLNVFERLSRIDANCAAAPPSGGGHSS